MYSRLIFLDLDNTLSRGTDTPIESEVLEYLLEYEQRGWGVVICSGRPHYYLCGLARQLPLSNQILIGENGLTIHMGKDLPSADYYHLSVDEEVLDILDDLRSQVRQKLRSGEWSHADVWIQPNESAVTFFFGNSVEGRELLREFLTAYTVNWCDKIDLIEHDNCFDVLPHGFNKGVGIKFLIEKLGISTSQTVAVGDGPNDQEMFDAVGYAISLSPGKHQGVDFETDDILQALRHIAALG